MMERETQDPKQETKNSVPDTIDERGMKKEGNGRTFFVKGAL